MSAVLLVHFQNSSHTLECLDSLFAAAKHSPFDIYILAVQSQDHVILTAHKTHPTVISEEKNGGFAWANNRLMQAALKAGHTHLILLNNDTTVQPEFLTPLLHVLKEKNVGMVCPKIYFYPGNEYHHDYTKAELGKVIWYAGGVIDWKNVHGYHWGVDEVDHGQFDARKETDFATGCCLAVTKQTVEKIGFMDEKYFLYSEDVDWSIRAKNHHFKIMVEPKSVVWHKNAGSTGGSGSKMHVYYQTRNRLSLGLKYAPLRTKLHLIKNTLHAWTHPDLNIRRANQDALLRKMGKRVELNSHD